MSLMQPPVTPAPFEFGVMSPVELARLLFHSKWKIAGLALVAGLLAALYAYAQKPTYLATATVLIEPRPNKAVQMQEVYDPGIDTDNYFQTQVAIVQSRTLIAKVIQKLDLSNKPEFSTKDTDAVLEYWQNKFSHFNWHKLLPFLPEGKATGQSSVLAQPAGEEFDQTVIDNVQRNLIALPWPRTQLIRINFISQSPVLAATIANSFADAYIEFGLEARLETSKKATRWLTEKLSDISNTLKISEQALQKFREQEQIVSVGGARGLIDEELLDNSRRLRESQKKRTELSNTYSKIQQAGNDVRQLEQISDLLGLPLVQGAKSNLLSALEALKQLQQRYGEKHPLLANALTRVEAAERTFRDQILLAAQNVRTEYEIAKENEQVLGGRVESGKEQIRTLDRKAYELSVLERDVASNRQLYDLFLTSFKGADTSSSYEPINVRILEMASQPTTKYEPSIRKYCFYGLLTGFLAGIALVFISRILDETVRSPEDVETLTGLPVISVIPKVPMHLGARKSLPAQFNENPRTPFAEGVRSMRASLKLNDVDKNYKRILVTSALPGEGKSSLSSCLAMAFSAGERVLLIEGDLRAPTVKKIFSLPKDGPGIMELLTGEAKLEECLYLHEGSQLQILPVSKTPSNPSEVVNSAAFTNLIGALSERFDRIVIDSPPCQAASDALVLAKMADVVLLTIMADSTHRRTVSNTVKQLKQIQAHIIGSVLNQVDSRKNPLYADSYYYAQKYYG